MSYAQIVFPELEKELQKNPKIIGKIRGVFEVTITEKGSKVGTYYIVLSRKPFISTTKPTNTKLDQFKWVYVQVEDKDMLKMISGTLTNMSYVKITGVGGMNGMKAYTSGKLKISGDLVLARQAEKVFIKAGGVEKVMKYIKRNYPRAKL